MFGGKCYVCYDKQEFIDLTGEDLHDRTLALVSREKKLAMYLMSKDCLNHELIHLSWFILDYSGVDISVNNHECLAYLHDSLREIIEADPNYIALPDTHPLLEI